jgi:hypothetical protein
MTCTRCKGFMVLDDLIDLRESFVPMWMRGWRCIACGNIVDPLILRHRRARRSGTRPPLTLDEGLRAFAGSSRGRIGTGA